MTLWADFTPLDWINTFTRNFIEIRIFGLGTFPCIQSAKISFTQLSEPGHTKSPAFRSQINTSYCSAEKHLVHRFTLKSRHLRQLNSAARLTVVSLNFGRHRYGISRSPPTFTDWYTVRVDDRFIRTLHRLAISRRAVKLCTNIELRGNFAMLHKTVASSVKSPGPSNYGVFSGCN